MAQQIINHGSVAKDGTGESLFSVFAKVNSNATELYDRSSRISAIEQTKSTMLANSAKYLDNQIVSTVGRVTAGDRGSARYQYHATGRSGVSIDGMLHTSGSLADDYFELLPGFVLIPQQWGAVGDGATDDHAVLQKVIDYAGEREGMTVLLAPDISGFGLGSTLVINGTFPITLHSPNNSNPTLQKVSDVLAIHVFTSGANIQNVFIQGIGSNPLPWTDAPLLNTTPGIVWHARGVSNGMRFLRVGGLIGSAIEENTDAYVFGMLRRAGDNINKTHHTGVIVTRCIGDGAYLGNETTTSDINAGTVEFDDYFVSNGYAINTNKRPSKNHFIVRHINGAGHEKGVFRLDGFENVAENLYAEGGTTKGVEFGTDGKRNTVFFGDDAFTTLFNPAVQYNEVHVRSSGRHYLGQSISGGYDPGFFDQRMKCDQGILIPDVSNPSDETLYQPQIRLNNVLPVIEKDTLSTPDANKGVMWQSDGTLGEAGSLWFTRSDTDGHKRTYPVSGQGSIYPVFAAPLFPGDTSYVLVALRSFGGDFTLNFSIWPLSDTGHIVSNSASNSSVFLDAGQLGIAIDGTVYMLGLNVSTNQESRIQVVRTGTNIETFLDGVSQGTVAASSGTWAYNALGPSGYSGDTISRARFHGFLYHIEFSNGRSWSGMYPDPWAGSDPGSPNDLETWLGGLMSDDDKTKLDSIVANPSSAKLLELSSAPSVPAGEAKLWMSDGGVPNTNRGDLLLSSNDGTSTALRRFWKHTPLEDLGDLATGTALFNFDAHEYYHVRAIGNIDVVFATVRVGPHYGVVEQDGTGGHTITITSPMLGSAPSIGTTAGAKTLLKVYFDGTAFHWMH